jgi:hypothetical protein
MYGNIRSASWLSASLLIASFGAAGCGSSGGSSGTGTLSVQMVDAPMTDMAHVNVWISKCEASGPNGWETIFSADPATVQPTDLLTLARSPMQVGSVHVQAGHYNQIRLIVTKAQLVKTDGSTADVTIPSGAQTGIKLNVNADVAPNTITGVLLDFNADASFHETPPGSGNWTLNPVIPATLQVMSGTISGTVTDNGAPVAGAQVFVYPAGADMATATPVNTSATLADGTFKVWALLAGSYDVKVTFTDATNTTLTHIFPGVTVTANQDTSLQTISLGP